MSKVIIKNKTSNKVIANNAKLCSTVFSKACGLMFSQKKRLKSLIFQFDDEKKVSLHMFFVFYPIDVIYLDKNKRVVEIKKNFKPFTIYFPNKSAKYVLEVPTGQITNSKTKVGDRVILEK